MSHIPEANYRVIDCTDLDDLIIWTQQGCLAELVKSSAYRENLKGFLEQITVAPFYCSPISLESSKHLPSDPPIVVHISLFADEITKAFLYFDNAVTELHLPERLMVTGVPKHDDERMRVVRQLVEGLASALGIDWRFAEFGGMATVIDDFDSFWIKCKLSVFERISYELESP